MTRAEEAAMKAYPIKDEWIGNQYGDFGDVNFETRKKYQEGYEQAEKDLGWISVKERLPETTDYVFTCIDDEGVPQCVGFHYYKNGKWFDGYEEDTVDAVEYWMPIPRLKNKEEKK